MHEHPAKLHVTKLGAPSESSEGSDWAVVKGLEPTMVCQSQVGYPDKKVLTALLCVALQRLQLCLKGPAKPGARLPSLTCRKAEDCSAVSRFWSGRPTPGLAFQQNLQCPFQGAMTML